MSRTIRSAKILAPLMLVVVAGCRSDDTPGELEAVEVVADPITQFDPDEDARGASVAAPALRGLLPSDFPSGLPLPDQASVYDFGEIETGRRYVTLDVVSEPEALRGWIERAWTDAGWAASAGGGYDRGERSVRGAVEELVSGRSLLRLEYTTRAR